MEYFYLLILIILMVFHLSSIMKNAFLSYKKIEGTSHIHAKLKKLKYQRDKRYQKRLIIWIILMIIYISLIIYGEINLFKIFHKVKFDVSEILLHLLIFTLFFIHIYTFGKRKPDISNILTEDYEFQKVGNSFERSNHGKFRYDVNYVLDPRIGIPKYRTINTEFSFELDNDIKIHDLASYRNLTDYFQSVSQLESDYLAVQEISPIHIREYMTKTQGKRKITIKMKNKVKLYPGNSNKYIATLLLLALEESEKVAQRMKEALP